MAIKNIIWDWNGTIVDDAWVFVSVMNNILQKNKLPLTTVEHYRKNFCFPIQDYWKALGFEFTEESFNQLNESFIKEYQNKMFLPEIHRGLKLLFNTLKKKQLQQFILSASENNLLQKSVIHYRLESFFSGIYGVDNLNALGKEALGRRLCLKHNLASIETVLIGDTEYDCRVASALGCSIVLVSHGHINPNRLLKTGAPVMSSVKELTEYLRVN